MKLSSQQEADCALAIWQAHRDDQERIDRMLREFFSQVREEERTAEFNRQMRIVELEFPTCVTSTSEFSSPSSALSSLGV